MSPQHPYSILLYFTIVYATLPASANQDEYLDSSTNTFANPSRVLVPANNLTSYAGSADNVLVLIPSGINLSESNLDDGEFNLFKLNTDILLNSGKESKQDEVIDHMASSDPTESDSNGHTSTPNNRESRKFNFLSGMWNRKTSPLYLVNGTVCRFINNAPICTTLSTTGLLPTGGGARPATQGVSGQEGSVVQFDRPANQQNQPTTQRPRPAAILDDDSQDIIVESTNNASNDSRVVRGQSQPSQRPVPAVQASRPVNFVVSRRPLNLLALRRPVRNHPVPGVRSRDTQSDAAQQGRRGGRVTS